MTLGPVPVWLYHVDVLRGRLHHATGNLLLYRFRSLPDNDSDLLELLHQLERTLVFDPQTMWQTIERAEASAGTDEPESVRWEDLDWRRLYQHPRYGAYRPVRPLSAAAAGRS